jgi:hypothetical protein
MSLNNLETIKSTLLYMGYTYIKYHELEGANIIEVIFEGKKLFFPYEKSWRPIWGINKEWIITKEQFLYNIELKENGWNQLWKKHKKYIENLNEEISFNRVLF